MAQLLVRNLEDAIVTALKKRAAAEGKSLEQSLREILRDAAMPEVARRVAMNWSICASGPPLVHCAE